MVGNGLKTPSCLKNYGVLDREVRWEKVWGKRRFWVSHSRFGFKSTSCHPGFEALELFHRVVRCRTLTGTQRSSSLTGPCFCRCSSFQNAGKARALVPWGVLSHCYSQIVLLHFENESLRSALLSLQCAVRSSKTLHLLLIITGPVERHSGELELCI